MQFIIELEGIMIIKQVIDYKILNLWSIYYKLLMDTL